MKRFPRMDGMDFENELSASLSLSAFFQLFPEVVCPVNFR